MRVIVFAVAALLGLVSAVPTDRVVDVGREKAILGVQVAERTWRYNGQFRSATLHANEPTICDKVKQYSGFFKLGSQDKKYFYWFFESRSAPTTDPTIMWLTGGPGCSSQLALLAENGPCKVNPTASSADDTEINPASWNSKANLLYVDQPPGTGFSTGEHDHDEAGVAEDMYQFLQAFFSAYPAYNTHFFVFGESYAGHYVPAVSHRIFRGNDSGDSALTIKLEGLAVGNGLTDPQVQYAYYADMAYNSSFAPSVVSKFTYEAMKLATPACIAAIKGCNENKTLDCSAAFTGCNMALTSPVQATGINLYDMRVKCQVPPLCYNFSAETAYLNLPDVQQAIGVQGKWQSCNMGVNGDMRGDWMKNYQNQLPDLLANDIRVLIYAGDQDFICNWMGNKAWTLQFEWAGKAQFNAAPDHDWTVEGKKAGIIRTANGMTFLQVFQGGHMVPMDQPVNALMMTNSFLANTLA